MLFYDNEECDSSKNKDSSIELVMKRTFKLVDNNNTNFLNKNLAYLDYQTKFIYYYNVKIIRIIFI